MTPSVALTLRSRHTSEDLAALALLYEREGLRSLEEDVDAVQQAESKFDLAFEVLSHLAESSHWRLECSASFPRSAEEVFRSGLPEDVVRNELLLAFRIAVAGSLADRIEPMRRELIRARSIRPFHFGDFVVQAFLELTKAAPSAKRFAEIQRGFLELRVKPWIDGTRGGNAIVAGFDHLMEIVSGAFQQIADRHAFSDRFIFYVRDHHRHARAAFEGATARAMLLHLADLTYFGTLRVGRRRP